MAAATSNINTLAERFGDVVEYGVAASTLIYAGTLVARNAAGYLVPASADAALTVLGRAEEKADNSSGANGAIKCKVKRGIFRCNNSSGADAIAVTDAGKRCYVVDDNTVALTNGDGARPLAGVIFDVEGGKVDVDMRPGRSDGGAGVLRMSVQVEHSDLTAAATSETINIGDALPANAFIVGRWVEVTTAMSGGSASSVTVDVGTSANTDSIIDGADVFTGAVSGSGTAGVSPVGFYSAAQLQATFTSDVNVAALTAGDITIHIAYAVL